MKIASHTLGCKVNSYETNALLELFLAKGYHIVDFSKKADIYLINTCIVTNTSEAKSRKYIRQAIKKNAQAKIIVMGCYAQNKPSEVLKMEGVSIIVGTKDRLEILKLIEVDNYPICTVNQDDNWEYENMRVTKFDHTRAFLKIQDGCDNFCSYCIIPYVRGKSRYKDFDLCINEATQLIKNNYKEIVLTGIHTGNYPKLSELINTILDQTAILRLRISSMEILNIDEFFLKILKNNHKLCPHLHLPLQSGSNTVLQRMNRRYSKEEYIDKIKKIREIIPNIAITTDLIVGFPEETQEEFLETIATINQLEFAFIHIFPFSKREGTKAAQMNLIHGDIIKNRIMIINDINKQFANSYAHLFLGKILEVIPETYNNGFLIGHTSNYLKVEFVGDVSLIGQNVSVLLEKTAFPLNKGKIV